MLAFAVLEITNRCNLKCQHCYGFFDRRDEIGDDNFHKVLNELIDCKCKQLTLSGGEPFLLGEKVFRYAKAIKQAGLKALIVTNGTIIDPAYETYYSLFDTIQISIDGPCEIHEAIRGRNTYAKSMASVQYLKSIGANVSIQITITDLNQYHFFKIFDMAQAMGIRLSVERASLTGRAEAMAELDPDNYRKILDCIVSNRLATSDPLRNVALYEKYHIDPPNDAIYGCSAGLGGIAITCNMDVFPCVRIRTSIGSLTNMKLKDIVNSTAYLSFGNRDNGREPCSSCKYKYACGGCQADKSDTRSSCVFYHSGT
jgi:radical SAM protein with 4Fe4S-binding SPASM domain